LVYTIAIAKGGIGVGNYRENNDGDITMNKKINLMYFSATDTTKKVVYGIADSMLENLDLKIITKNIDFTLPYVRERSVSFTGEDIVIIGVPVYAGRVPNVLLKYLNSLNGNGAWTIPVVVYGNRNYDDALIEFNDILKSRGFTVIAGAAFIGEHSFSRTLAQNRPDEKDMDIARDFANQIYRKIVTGVILDNVVVNGNKPYRNYYRPKDKEGNPVDIREVKPKTNTHCTNCKLCVSLCPMGSIDNEDVSKFNYICIKCGACIKKCPSNAKYYDNEDYLRHKHELEVEFFHRREPQLFI
jgi:ferredoxin/flavodoxin